MKINMTIKQKLYFFSGISVTLIIILIGVATFYVTEVEQLNSLQNDLQSVNIEVLKLRKSEKDFMLREARDEQFFTSGKSDYSEKIENGVQKILKLSGSIKDNRFIENFGLENDVLKIEKSINTYKSVFSDIVQAYFRRGYLTYGLVGKMREASHGMEEHSFSDNIYKIKILMMRRHEKDYMLRKDEKYAEKLNALQKELNNDVINRNALGDNDFRIQHFAEELSNYIKSFNGVVATNKLIGTTETEGLQGKMRAAIHDVGPTIDVMSASINSKSKAQKESILRWITIIFISVMFGLSFVVYSIVSSITKSINEARSVVKAMSKGDLTIEINVEQKDEIGSLLEDMQLMLKKLKDILQLTTSITSNISGASRQMNDASKQISVTSQSVSQSANEQAASVEEISSSMEEMLANIQQNTENSQQTERIAIKATDDISKGSVTVNKTVEAMNKIVEKTMVIEEIASKTDLLAINAAVEAARAGEHGTGFAVVANEIRHLAENSQRQVLEINEISSISVDTARHAKELLEKIVPDILKTTQLVKEISASSVEQNSGAQQVNNAIQQLNQVTQQNASTSEELASGAEEFTSISDMLNNYAMELKDAIAFFTIPETEVRKQNPTTKKKLQPDKKSDINHDENGVMINMEDGEVEDNEYEKY